MRTGLLWYSWLQEILHLNYLITIRCFWFRVRYFAGICHVVPECSAVPDVHPIPIKAKYFVIFYGLAELFMGVANNGGDSVAHFAHLGGMLFGYFLVRYWKKKDIDNGRYFY